jgi:hypothetical protein
VFQKREVRLRTGIKGLAIIDLCLEFWSGYHPALTAWKNRENSSAEKNRMKLICMPEKHQFSERTERVCLLICQI